MIPPEEFRVQAEHFGLNEADIQRDYVFGWLLAGIFAGPLGGQLVLKGGNALRKGYFEDARFSDDLDLSTPTALDGAAVLDELNAACASASDKSGIPFDLSRNRVAREHQIDEHRTVHKYRLYFTNLMGQSDHITLSVRLDITDFDRLYLPVQEMPLIHPYSDADQCSATLRCVKLEEALADKMKCLLQRRYCNDLFDLVYGAFVSRSVPVDRTEMLGVFLRKTIFESSPGSAGALLLGLPLDLFRGYWGSVVCPSSSRMTFDEAVNELQNGVNALFGPSISAEGMGGAFYPSMLRNPILQAGSERRLLEIRYGGVNRVAEPYSLVFKRRRDGFASEYFYVWDRTGGRSGPGIKALFHNRIERLTLLVETFEPRFEVELAKAGDRSQSGYFSQQSGPRPAGRRSPGTSRLPRVTGPQYKVQCAVCGRVFIRKTRNTAIATHKNTYGGRCSGRRGHMTF